MKTKLLLGVFILLVIAHLWGAVHAAQHLGLFYETDSHAYIGLATNLAQTGQYVHPTDPDEDLYRPPVYPIFLLGIQRLSRNNLTTVPLAQTMLYFFGAYLLYLSGKTLLGARAGIAAALLYLINPNSTFWSYILLTETLASFLLILVVYLFILYWRSSRLRWLALAGISLGLGALTRPIIFPLAFIWIGLFGLLLWLSRKNSPPRPWWQPVLLLSLGLLAIVTPWQARNYITYQKFTISNVGSHTLFAWNAARILEQAQGYSFTEAQKILELSADPLAYSLELVRQYPGIALQLQVRGILRTLLGAEYDTWSYTFTGDFAPRTGILNIIFGGADVSALLGELKPLLASPWFWAGIYALVYDTVLFLTCLLAVIRNYRQRPSPTAWQLVLILGIGISYLMLIPLAAGDSRFRVLADPLLALLAGLAWLPDMVKSSLHVKETPR